jgi:hypothetical protein
MKKVALASLLAIATSTLCATPFALAQAAAGGGGTQQITIKDPAEYNDYSNAISQSSPAAKSAAIEAFLTKYPNSVVKEDMLEQLMVAYQAQNNLDKTVDAAQRLLQVDPNNLRALAITVYIKKQQAAAKTSPAEQQPLLDEAAANAQKGLAAPKPANLSDADYQKLKAAVTPIFYSAIALDDQLKKDYPGAEDSFKKELGAVPPAQTQTGPTLNDTYLLGQAYAQQNPPDLKNAVWFLTRAAAYAPPAAKDQIEKAAEYYYNKYHGSMDGFDQVKAQVTQSVLPPDSYNPTAAPPPPSPAEQAAKVVSTTPDLKTLNLNDKEFILFNGKQKDPNNPSAPPEDADKMWDTMKGQTYQIPGKVVSATPDTVQLAVTDDAKASNTADFTIKMKKPLTTPPAIGTMVNYDATFDSYTQNPKFINLVVGTPPAPETPAHRAPARRRTTL